MVGGKPTPVHSTLYRGLGMLVFAPLALAFTLTIVQRTLGLVVGAVTTIAVLIGFGVPFIRS